VSARRPDRRTAPRTATAVAWAVLGTLLVAGLAAFGLLLLPRLVHGGYEVPDGAAAGQRLVSRYPAVVQDQGNTVTLPDGRTLWIFADTAQDKAEPHFFVTSSAAVSDPDSLYVRFTTGSRGVPVEFLPRTAAERARTVNGKRYVAVWPTGATTLADGRVVVAYTKYVVGMRPTSFTFQAAGLYEWRPPRDGDVAGAGPARRIADDIWRPADGAIASPVAVGRYVYFTQCESGRCYSTRAPTDQLADRGAYRWWTGVGWSPSRGDRQPMTYGSDRPGRNPPTAYLPASRVFATVDTSGGIQSSTGLIWVAPRPWGPWSKAARFPLPGCTSADGCYTLNLHPGESTARSVRVSYATAHTGPYVHVLDVPVAVAPGADGVTVKPR
jgi:hypothetical protein